MTGTTISNIAASEPGATKTATMESVEMESVAMEPVGTENGVHAVEMDRKCSPERRSEMSCSNKSNL